MRVDGRVEEAMFKRLLNGAKVSLTGSACGSLLVMLSQFGAARFRIFMSWAALVYVVILVRYLVTRYVVVQARLHGFKASLTYRYCMTFALSGVSWGALALLLPGSDAMTKVLIVIAIQSMVMGSVLTMAPSMTAFFTFTLPSMLPLIAVFAIAPGTESKVIAVYSTIFLALMVWITHGINQSLRNTERIRFENNDLILSLKKANEKISIQNEELNHVAHHDQLTALPNRKLLAMRLQQSLEIARLRQTAVAILFLDLDGFKAVNDGLGHEAGDEALIQVSRRLGTVLRGSDMLARVGGDEFVILLADIDAGARNAVEVVARKCLEAFASPFMIQSQTHTLATSIGLVMSGGEADPERLLAMADKAMYQAKQRAPGQFCWAQPELLSEHRKLSSGV